MKKIKGFAVTNESCLGVVAFKDFKQNQNLPIENVLKEEKKLYNAVKSLKQKIQTLKSNSISDEILEICEVQLAYLQDEELFDEIKTAIRDKKVSIIAAVDIVQNQYEKDFENITDEEFKTRLDDLKGLLQEIKNFCFKTNNSFKGTDKFVLYSEDIYPMDILKNKDNIIGCISKNGSKLSHTSLLCKSLNIPYIMGVELKEFDLGKFVIIDGENSVVIVEPNNKLTETYICQKSLKKQQIKPFKTNNVEIFANIANNLEITDNFSLSGVGLFRTEFLYMAYDRFPTEEEQLKEYLTVVEKLKEKPVVIRTLDLGSDKQLDYFKYDEDIKKNNYRSIQISLRYPEIFKTQISAITRANVKNTVSILLPYIETVDELKKAKRIIEETIQALKQKYKKINPPKIGIMIESEKAIKNIKQLVVETDFISIGTNDLTESLYNISRTNSKEILDYSKLLQAIKIVVENSHKHNKKVCICGDFATNLKYTETLVKMCIDRLSVPISCAYELSKVINDIEHEN